MKKDVIDIYCDTCKKEFQLSFEDSFNNTTIICTECGTKLYWFSCPRCETGYSSSDKNAACPTCSATEHPFENVVGSNAPKKYIWLKRIISQPCPWCGYDIITPYFKGNYGYYENIFDCPRCKGSCESYRGWLGFVIYLIVFVIFIRLCISFFELLVLYLGTFGKYFSGFLFGLFWLICTMKFSRIRKFDLSKFD